MGKTQWSEDWPFEVDPLSPLMAAEITGLNAAQSLDDFVRDSILEALGRYKVLVLRNQDLAPADQAAFTK